ncbi:MAG: hypothetical protein U1A27_04075 [Phycisphaerae bacterium]
MSKLSVWHGRAGLALVLLTCGLGACSDDTFTLKISRPADERPDYSDPPGASAVHVPGEQPFNLVPFTSGQNGHGSGQASATPAGNASAKGQAENGGSAFGEFQLGYAFDYAGKKPGGAVVHVKLEASQATETDGGDADTSAAATLTLLVKDSNGLALHTEPLLVGKSPGGTKALSAAETSTLDLPLAPGVGYYIVVAGRVDAKSATGKHSASAALDVKGCAITLEWRSGGEARAAAVSPAASP